MQLKQRVDFAPQYMHHASEETVQRMAEQADPFGKEDGCSTNLCWDSNMLVGNWDTRHGQIRGKKGDKLSRTRRGDRSASPYTL